MASASGKWHALRHPLYILADHILALFLCEFGKKTFGKKMPDRFLSAGQEVRVASASGKWRALRHPLYILADHILALFLCEFGKKMPDSIFIGGAGNASGKVTIDFRPTDPQT